MANPPDPAPEPDAEPDLTPELDQMLANIGHSGVRTVLRLEFLIRVECEVGQVVATWLPDKATPDASMADASAAGHAIDAVAAAMDGIVSRASALARAHDRTCRSVRLTVALRRRLQTKPRATPDTRAAMQRRQVKNAVSEHIRRQAEQDAPEHDTPERDPQERDAPDAPERDAPDREPRPRKPTQREIAQYAALEAQLNDPALDEELATTSVDAVVRRIYRHIALATAAAAPLLNPEPAPQDTG